MMNTVERKLVTARKQLLAKSIATTIKELDEPVTTENEHTILYTLATYLCAIVELGQQDKVWYPY